MSEATPFKVNGRGNGFGFCPDTIDVVEFETENDDEGIGLVTHWVTLGGYNKDAFDAATPVTDAQIELSLQNAMKLFWNLENVTGEASHASSGASVTAVPVTSGDPKERVCRIGIGGSAIDNPSAHAQISAGITIARMVDGATFLGYGISASPLTYNPSGQQFEPGILAYVDYGPVPQVGLYSMVTEDPFGFTEFAYIEKNGILFVGYAANGALDATVPSSIHTSTAVARIDNLEFFTYP